MFKVFKYVVTLVLTLGSFAAEAAHPVELGLITYPTCAPKNIALGKIISIERNQVVIGYYPDYRTGQLRTKVVANAAYPRQLEYVKVGQWTCWNVTRVYSKPYPPARLQVIYPATIRTKPTEELNSINHRIQRAFVAVQTERLVDERTRYID